MEFTKIPDWFKEEYDKKFLKKTLTLKEIEQDIVTWAYFMLGVKLRDYQAWCIHNIINSKTKRIALCWARQVGKSISLGIFAFWATFYNKYPATVENITTCFIMSRDDDTARELVEKIRGIIKMGDLRVFRLKKIENYFSQHFDKPSNQHQITWENRCFIKATAPTDTIIGKSASIFLGDEAAKWKVLSPYDDVKIYYEVIEPTTSETGGFLILSSTPNGCKGLFHSIFDPEDSQDTHEYERIWFNYAINDDPDYNKFVENRKTTMEKRGELKLWQQEYGAQFTVTQSSFFDIADIEGGVNETLTCHYSYAQDCSMGIDYGMNPSRTVITIKSDINGKFTTINQIRFPAIFDENLLMDKDFDNSIINLMKRYKIKWIVADDCPQGNMMNKWMQNKGYPIRLHNFRTDQTKGDRNRSFYKYRTALKAKNIKYPKLKDFIEEMKILEEVQHEINVSIKSPRGSLCDCVDSEIMACLPFLDDNAGLESTTTNPKKKMKPTESMTIDSEWEELRAKDNRWVIDATKKEQEANENG
jgi:hypothetical protein